VHESVEAPEPETVAGVREQVNPVLGEIAGARLTVPAKPCKDTTVNVEVPAAPALAVTSVGLAARVKSRTVNVTLVEWVRDPLVPVIVTV
jgi:hypothetical protein